MAHFAYVSGALTNLPDDRRQEYRDFYEALAQVFISRGFLAYVPHQYGDPVLFKDLTSQQIDKIDRTAVTQANLVVAYVGEPSIGTGIEIELAYHANVPVVLLFEKEKLKNRQISRLVRGNPAVICEISFVNVVDAITQLGFWFDEYLEKLRAEPIPTVLKPQPTTVV